MSKVPALSVVVPVYNASDYLRPVIDSILYQDFTDFELILIDDGSSDDSRAIIEEYAARDSRIVPVFHEQNIKLVRTLNEGIGLARAELIARADSDDYCLPKRFGRQVAFMKDHPDVNLLGMSFEVIDEEDVNVYPHYVPTLDDDIRRSMYLDNVLGHGTIVFRKAAVEQVGLYKEDTGHVEDFDLWVRLARIGELAALPNFGYRWRINPEGVTSNNHLSQRKHQAAIREDLWRDHPPQVVSSRELRRRGRYYVDLPGINGVAIKKLVLKTNIRLGIHMIKRGRALDGLRQIFSVILVGRSGIKATYEHFRHIWRVRRHKLPEPDDSQTPDSAIQTPA